MGMNMDIHVFNSIDKKILEFCSYGELTYKRIENTYGKSYEELDILRKKALLNKLQNTVIIRKSSAGNNITIIDKNVNIDETLKLMETKVRDIFDMRSGRQIHNNLYLDENAIWIKFYNNNREIDFVNDLKNTEALEKYVNNRIIIYALKHRLPVPYVDFNNLKMVTVRLSQLESLFNNRESTYISRELIHIEYN